MTKLVISATWTNKGNGGKHAIGIINSRFSISNKLGTWKYKLLFKRLICSR